MDAAVVLDISKIHPMSCIFLGILILYKVGKLLKYYVYLTFLKLTSSSSLVFPFVEAQLI